ncbi:MAG: DUF4286 family protein [Bacteroidota bacterium]
MILYNVTVKIDKEVHDDWLKWMQEIHIPDVMKTGLFLENKLCKILHEDPDGISYAIQYYCQDMKTLHRYQVHHAQRLQAEHTERYKDKYVAIRTLMEVL